MPLGILIYRDPLQNCWLLFFGIWHDFGSIVFLLSGLLFGFRFAVLSPLVQTVVRIALPVDSSNKGGRGRLQAQYTGADTGAGNSSLPNFNARH
jgi:hypothetical protein